MEIVKKGIMATPRWIFHRINIISCFKQCPVHFGTSARIPKIINEKNFRGYIFFKFKHAPFDQKGRERLRVRKVKKNNMKQRAF